MKLEHETVSASDWNTMDRRVIQVDIAPTQAGIAAAPTQLRFGSPTSQKIGKTVIIRDRG
jgi:hypothetical protein